MWTNEEAAQELLAVLPLINRMMVAELRQEAGENTTMPQFRVLAHLAEAPLTLSDIAQRRRVSIQAAGELIQALVDRGWITRVPNPSDRRQMLLHLTDEGSQHYERTQRRMLEQLIPIMQMLTPEESTALQMALPALHRVFAKIVNSEGNSDDS
jgi:DNA-binding MarR family transcriptional regulator